MDIEDIISNANAVTIEISSVCAMDHVPISERYMYVRMIRSWCNEILDEMNKDFTEEELNPKVSGANI